MIQICGQSKFISIAMSFLLHHIHKHIVPGESISAYHVASPWHHKETINQSIPQNKKTLLVTQIKSGRGELLQNKRKLRELIIKYNHDVGSIEFCLQWPFHKLQGPQICMTSQAKLLSTFSPPADMSYLVLFRIPLLVLSLSLLVETLIVIGWWLNLCY